MNTGAQTANRVHVKLFILQQKTSCSIKAAKGLYEAEMQLKVNRFITGQCLFYY